MSARFKKRGSASSSTESTPKKARAPGQINFLINDDNKGAMGFRFPRDMTELVDVLKDFKMKGVRVTSWHPQYKWWGIVAYESPINPPAQMGRTSDCLTENLVSACVAMAGDTEAGMLGSKGQNSVRFPFCALLSPSSFSCAPCGS